MNSGGRKIHPKQGMTEDVFPETAVKPITSTTTGTVSPPPHPLQETAVVPEDFDVFAFDEGI